MRKLSSFNTGTDYEKAADSAGLYIITTTLDKITYVFDAAFIHLVRYALTSFCTSEMTTDQLDLLLAYIDAVNAVAPFTDVTEALDQELVKLSLCVEDASAVVCGNSAGFTYVACGVDINL